MYQVIKNLFLDHWTLLTRQIWRENTSEDVIKTTQKRRDWNKGEVMTAHSRKTLFLDKRKQRSPQADRRENLAGVSNRRASGPAWNQRFDVSDVQGIFTHT